MKTKVMLLAAFLSFLAFAPSVALAAGPAGECETQEHLCLQDCDDMTDDCLTQIFGPVPHQNPGFCWDFNLRCRGGCIDAYQNCRWSQPLMTEEGGGDSEQQ